MYQQITKPLVSWKAPKSKTPLNLFAKLAVTLVLVASFGGCQEPQQAPAEKDTGIINKVTQDIGEAKPGAEQADMQAKGMTAVPGAYGFAVSQTSKLKIKRALDLYRARTGDYPKDYDEFMDEVIKKGGVDLPVLPGERQYQYDVKNHELIVVEKEQAEKEQTE